jgi:hypothetical protein
MKNLIWFILYSPLIFSNDYLLQAIYTDWDIKQENTENSISDSETPNASEAEHYSWKLGTPDNEVETEIIYSDEPSPCESTYR